jgi:FSR family fosmidomycin resistance protein-like MFS transporter
MTRTETTAASGILLSISFCHFLNDLIQSTVPALYPMLKSSLSLSFAQIGMLTFALQFSASVLQPIVGFMTDRTPRPFSLATGMTSTLAGVALLAVAGEYWLVVLAALLIGIGSSIFHPESSRVARMASGGRHGAAQSIFQVGGNIGSAAGPLLVALLVLPFGQAHIGWFSIAALTGILLLVKVGRWYHTVFAAQSRPRTSGPAREAAHGGRVAPAIAILLVLIFSKYFYMASLSSFYTLYLIDRFHVSVRHSQLLLFLFLGAIACGTLMGGPLGDRFGRRNLIWASIVGVLPFTLILPYANLFWTGVLAIPIGAILASAFPSIVVYAQDLMPGRTGTVAGLFFGFAFGMGGLGAVVLGALADATSIRLVFQVCAFLPLLGMFAALLPDVERRR